MKYDAIVIGAGPAGITSAIYAKRSGLSVCVIGKQDSNLLKADWIDNYYGFPGGISGKELFDNGIKQAIKLGVSVFNDEVLEIEWFGDFNIKTVKNVFLSKVVIMATGNKKNKVNINNIDYYLGKGVSYCAICDGFFFKNKKIGVLGNKDYALHEINVLKNISNDITLFNNGEKIEINKELLNDVKVKEGKITGLTGDDKLTGVLINEEVYELDALFIALGTASTSDLALKLGVITDNGKVVVNDKMETNVPGLYCVGDATGGLLQISKAVYEGSVAGLESVKYIKKNK